MSKLAGCLVVVVVLLISAFAQAQEVSSTMTVVSEDPTVIDFNITVVSETQTLALKAISDEIKNMMSREDTLNPTFLQKIVNNEVFPSSQNVSLIEIDTNHWIATSTGRFDESHSIKEEITLSTNDATVLSILQKTGAEMLNQLVPFLASANDLY